ncbi:MAG: hypothetical protein Q4E84_03290 [Clostridia bacterium]|nr:hypothetical protein [Clostridia bacterium]
MKKDISILVVNPAGNITIFVLDKFERSQYQNIATQLLAHKEFNAEQVAFILDESTMEMCGLEFCGNASRAFALMSAKIKGMEGTGSAVVNVSGVDHPLSVEINTETNYTKVKMPMPISVTTLSDTGIPLVENSMLVDFGGIVHLVLFDQQASMENFNKAKEFADSIAPAPATGVMFYDTVTGFLTPVVYVKDVDSTYFEGSCGSGSTAVAVAKYLDLPAGTSCERSFEFHQPAGSITTTISVDSGQLDAIYIEGPIEFGQVTTVEIEV